MKWTNYSFSVFWTESQFSQSTLCCSPDLEQKYVVHISRLLICQHFLEVLLLLVKSFSNEKIDGHTGNIFYARMPKIFVPKSAYSVLLRLSNFLMLINESHWKKGLIPNNFWTMKFKGKRIDNFRIKMETQLNLSVSLLPNGC